MWLFALDMQQFVVPVMLGAITFWLLRRSIRRLATGSGAATASATAPDVQSQNMAGLAKPPGEFDRWEVHMHDTARDLMARIDSKIVVLEQFIRQAAAEKERLEAAIAKAQALGLADRVRCEEVSEKQETPSPL